MTSQTFVFFFFFGQLRTSQSDVTRCTVIFILSINSFHRHGSVIADITMIHDEISWIEINQQNANLAAELQKAGHAVTEDILTVRGENASNTNYNRLDL